MKKILLSLSLLVSLTNQISHSAFNSGINNKLITAAYNSNSTSIKILIDSGANPNAKNKYGNTTLILATKKGHFDIVETLLSPGADFNDKNTSEPV